MFALAAAPPAATEKPDDEYVGDAKLDDLGDTRTPVLVYDAAFRRRALLKIDLIVIPLLTVIHICSALDKSNLANAKTLGMVADIGGDPTGSRYALLNAFYYISHAPFLVPLSLLGKSTRVTGTIALSACGWGAAATCFAAVTNFSGAYACRFFVGLGEAGYTGLVAFYMSRFYTRQAFGTRLALWVVTAPLGAFCNGILAYAVSFIHSDRLASWRILFLLEGLMTLVLGVAAAYVLPEDIDRCRWLDEDEKACLHHLRSQDCSPEDRRTNWRHVRATFCRWQQLIPVAMNICQQITGAALLAYLPSLISENGFTGATAQIATLAPYGSAAVGMVVASNVSDRCRNRGWPTQFGWWLMVAAFGIYLGVPTTNHAARFAALISADVGHYICVALIVAWIANNSGSESRRAVAVPLAVSCSSAVAVGSGYLFPTTGAPRYTMGSAVCLALSVCGSLLTFLYQALLWRENRRRDRLEGKPGPEHQPDTTTYADDAPGFRYFE